MQIFHSDHLRTNEKPIVLTIGYFDGVHLGHLAVLSRGRELADQMQGLVYVLTFSNHPREILRPEAEMTKLFSLGEKLKWLEEAKVDAAIVLEFSKPFAQLTAREFLTALYEKLHFSYLVLGYDARIGNDRLGNGQAMFAIAQELDYTLEYVPPYYMEGTIVSSSAIRQAILEGNFKLAQKLLGRPLSDSFSFHNGKTKGEG